VCNSQPKICNFVNFFFTHVHKMPTQRATRAPAARCVCVCVLHLCSDSGGPWTLLILPTTLPSQCSTRKSKRPLVLRAVFNRSELIVSHSIDPPTTTTARRLVGTAPALTDTPETHHGDLSMFHGHLCVIGRSRRRPRPHIRRSDGGRTQSDTTERASRTHNSSNTLRQIRRTVRFNVVVVCATYGPEVLTSAVGVAAVLAVAGDRTTDCNPLDRSALINLLFGI